MCQGVQALVSHETVVLTIQERHLALETSITQRLKWAAGANPSLSATLQQFEEALAANNVVLQAEAALATDAITLCNAILHFEALRTRTPEALTADASFLALINRCDECCQLVESCNSSVSELEESLMLNKLVPPSEKITPELIETLLTYIGEQITELNGSLDRLRSTCSSTKEGVRGQVGSIRSILTTHHKLMSDVRSILKSMAKQEEQDHSSEPLPGSVCEYVITYKTFSENFTSVLKQVMTDDITASVLSEIDAMAGTLSAQINRIYDDLVKFAPPLVVDNIQGPLSFTTVLKKSVDAAVSLPAVSPKKMSTFQRPDVQTVTPATPVSVGSPQTAPVNVGTPVVRKQEKVTRDPRTGKARVDLVVVMVYVVIKRGWILYL
ncbi:hypothetical protein NP493_886g01031 [Ridgeia piscesae]|uniref:Uncharacterized protein n=1 Tax=Ridgeia piscesae TaxID=27915 RepID=A0AAD9KL24_RIDPI|nr:hypothetical protein NP493_886g01031 [Ridgeia piscesae]